jgi:hypothetical protein
MTGTGDRRVAYMPLSQIIDAPRNPKQHDTTGIRASIDRFGVAELPLLDERTGRLVAGHGRLNDARTRRDEGQDPPDGVKVHPDTGDWLIPVVRGWASRSDAEAEAYLVASNNLTTRGGWDTPALTQLLSDLADHDPALLEVTAFSAGDLDDMLKLLEPPDLDELGRDLGEPRPDDTWPIVRVKAAPHVAAAWRSHLETHDGDENAALAALLEVDPDLAPASDWSP